MAGRQRLSALLLLWSWACVVPAFASGYVPRGTCAGFPRVDIQAPKGHCVALLADGSSGLRAPRRILEVAPGRFWIVDMGSWERRQGRLLELRLDEDPSLPAPQVQLTVLAEKLDRPLGLARGPDGKVYVAEAGRIWRTALSTVRQETVVDGLPDDGVHPLKEIAFGRPGQLFFNLGSATDDCRDASGGYPQPCPEIAGPRPRAAVYEAVLGSPAWRLQSMRPWATGLRNSVALAYVPEADVLLQGENSIDYADENEPPETLNLLRRQSDHGWPHCVGARQPARGQEGHADCRLGAAPLQLWPAHAAPLQLLAVPRSMPGPLSGRLVVAWHGYRKHGHRVVSWALNGKGVPTGPMQTWLGGWSAREGVRPQGAPTGLAVDARGRLFVVEDRNATVLMVAPEDAP